MRMYDIIEKKRCGTALTPEEIDFVVQGFTAGTLPDYQIAALLMAICLWGMTGEETAHLTAAMAASGDMVDLSCIPGVKVDKHSTGGVGDKTTLVVAPLVAALGVKVAKMSGRGLGHTGGTIDKLEAIPGFRTTLSREDFLQQVREIGIAVVGQSGRLAPADKKMYALRDVTATVESIPLIASSIMSKKLAAGADAILLDVKVGSGAFMKTLDNAILLAQAMVEIGEENGRRTAALITDMDTPLGANIGNGLEVAEAVATLQNHGPEDLTAVCLALAAEMLVLAGQGPRDECMAAAKAALEDGRGYQKLCEMVAAQGGDVAVLEDTSRLTGAKYTREVRAAGTGYITGMDSARVGVAAMLLGAGRETQEDVIDPGAGIVLRAKTGDAVRPGQLLAVLQTDREDKLAEAETVFLASVYMQDAPPPALPLVLARVTKEGVQRL